MLLSEFEKAQEIKAEMAKMESKKIMLLETLDKLNRSCDIEGEALADQDIIDSLIESAETFYNSKAASLEAKFINI